MEYDMSDARYQSHRSFNGIVAILLTAALLWPAAVRADSSILPSRHLLANGLDVTVIGTSYLLSRMSTVQGSPAIQLDATRYISVITDVSDPSIYNKGDGEFHPFFEEQVLSALSAVTHPHLRFRVTVYLLPYPRRNVLVSSTSGTEIFLSPHMLDIQPEVVAYIVTHELGHAFHNKFMPDGSSAWDEYRSVRGIEDTFRFSEQAVHSFRPKEIFAEDFRVMFGGEMAKWDGTIENSELPSPVLVAGLDEFFLGIGTESVTMRGSIVATSLPNPFNPETEIRVVVPADVRAVGGDVTIRIYDVTGALVRDVYSDIPVDEEVRAVWDGRDNRGNQVASAQYFAQIRAGESTTTLKLVMLK